MRPEPDQVLHFSEDPTTTETDAHHVLGPGGGARVHAIEYDWLDALRTIQLYAYRLPATAFRPVGTPLSRCSG